MITLDCFHSENHFNQEGINLLEAISHQTAVALEKANLYQEKETHLTKVDDAGFTMAVDTIEKYAE